MRLLYAALAYGAFIVVVGWAAWFLADGIDAPARSSAPVALAVDGALLLAFAAHHTVAARPAFKRLLPAAVERSTYVLVASLLLGAVLLWWQPVPAVLWHVPAPWSAAIWALYGAGWVIVVASTFMVDHAEFFGLAPARDRDLSIRWMYAWCRHPMMLGLLLTFWATPHLSVGHLFFAASSSAYIALGIRFEERALRTRFGAAYDDYARRVPAVIPGLGPWTGRGSS